MKKTLVFAALLAISFLQAPALSLAQTAPPPKPTEDANVKLAINLMRAINTAEMSYKMTRGGAFVSWDTLVSADAFNWSDKAMSVIAQMDPRLANVQFSTSPNALPGWVIQINTDKDGTWYSVVLEGLTDKGCGYIVTSDQTGIIRQSTIACPLS